jgi:polysaccharide export outer membrane protein
MRLFLALIVVCGLSTAAAAQALQPGDTIQISVFEDPKLDRQMIIPRGGMISFPLAGQIKAGGLTPAGLEQELRARLRDKYTTDLNISVSLLASREDKIGDEDLKPRIYVTGEVAKPGPYVIRTRTNIMQAISLSGGLGKFAADQRIQVRRRVNGVESIFVFDYRAFESGRDMTGNIDLRAGDVIIVPERGLLE